MMRVIDNIPLPAVYPILDTPLSRIDNKYPAQLSDDAAGS
jgi:hypothetical protein